MSEYSIQLSIILEPHATGLSTFLLTDVLHSKAEGYAWFAHYGACL